MDSSIIATAQAVIPSLFPFFQATAVYFVVAAFVTNKIVFSIFKCLPIATLIWFTARHRQIQSSQSNKSGKGASTFSNSSRYARLVLIGICSSLLGDVCVVYKEDLLLGAIATFGFAHCCFATAFSLPEEAPLSLVRPFNLPVFIFVFLLVLGPNLVFFQHLDDTMSYAVMLYSMLIGVMCWRALSKFSFGLIFNHGAKGRWTLLTRAIGGLSFVLSDGILTYNLFVLKNVQGDSLTSVMIAYYGAELCFALSVIGSGAVALKSTKKN